MLLIAMLLSATDPMRPTNANIVSGQSLIDLQTCSSRLLSARGVVTPIPTNEGIALEWKMGGFLISTSGESKLALVISDDGTRRQITVTYRHPMSDDAAYGFLRDVGRRCFKEEYNAASQEARGKGKPIN